MARLDCSLRRRFHTFGAGWVSAPTRWFILTLHINCIFIKLFWGGLLPLCMVFLPAIADNWRVMLFDSPTCGYAIIKNNINRWVIILFKYAYLTQPTVAEVWVQRYYRWWTARRLWVHRWPRRLSSWLLLTKPENSFFPLWPVFLC